ncbi:MAG: hypothetical protein JJU05_00845 [Verrucomicrobia bacterium]|nr:hypothetical protein [Verrucomicrobiota bacterium]MCH8525969.1 hypothetical protein [Kiritimatiellia bacterium]
MKIKRTLWALALAPATLLLAETSPVQPQSPANPATTQTVSGVRYRRAGGARRNFQWNRERRESPETRDRRAGGVKRNRLHSHSARSPQASEPGDVRSETRSSTPVRATVPRAGGVKRGLLQRSRPEIASDLTPDTREPSTRRAGGVKRRF